MAPLRILIQGGGIAGPAAALHLARLGHSCTVLERFPALRAGGQQIDIRSQGLEAVKRLGILDEVKKNRVDESGVQFVDKNGKVKAFFGRNDSGKGRQAFTSDYEIMRGDLSGILYDATKDASTYRFGTAIEGFKNVNDKVEVKLSDGSEETYDLVIGADGQGSRLRRMMFAEEENVVETRYLGVDSCFYELSREPKKGSIATAYLAPGRRVMATRWHKDDQGQAYLSIISDKDDHGLAEAMKQGVEEQKKAFDRAFRGAGWEADGLIEAMHQAKDFYAAPIVQIKSKKWSNGRVTLLGDAGYAPSPLTGMGTSLALIGATVLSGELAKHGNDVTAALAGYEKTLRPFVEEIQKLPPGAPGAIYQKTEFGVKVLHLLAGAFTKFKIDKLLLSILPENKGTWRIPQYPEQKVLEE